MTARPASAGALLALLALAGPPAAAGDAVPTGAVPVPFARADGGEVSEAIAAAFVRPMLKLPAGEPVDFAWARFDVDGDGYDELALSLRGADRCGDDGCPFLLMRRKADGAWKAVMATPALSVSTMPDAPRRSRLVLTGSSQGSREWHWDPDGVRMVPRDADPAVTPGTEPVAKPGG